GCAADRGPGAASGGVFNVTSSVYFAPDGEQQADGGAGQRVHVDRKHPQRRYEYDQLLERVLVHAIYTFKHWMAGGCRGCYAMFHACGADVIRKHHVLN